MTSGVYQRKSLARRLLENIEKTPSCWNWTGATSCGGYGRIGHKNKVYQAHRVSYELFKHKLFDPDWWVCHSCDNRLCLNPDHLFLGNREINIDDCVSKDRHVFGENHVWSKLNTEQVIDIKNRISVGEALKSISEEYAVTWGTIYAIKRGFSWRQI